MRPRKLAVALLCLPILFAGRGAEANIFTIVAMDEMTVPGVGDITSIDNLAINDFGQWLVESATNHPDANANVVLITNGLNVRLRENQSLPGTPGTAQLSSFDSVNIDNGGRFSGNIFLRNTGSTSTDSGVYQDANLIMQESFISTATGFTAGTPYIGWFETRSNNSLQHLMIASVDDLAIASSVDRAVVLATVQADGTLVSETVIAKEGDTLPGHTQAAADFGTSSGSFAVNDTGAAMYLVDGNGTSTDDFALYLGFTMLAREGSPSPIVGRNWGASGLGSSKMSLNNNNDYVYTGVLDASDTSNDLVIIKNGAKFMQEGDTLPAIGGTFTFTSFGTCPPQIDNDGNVLWYGDWNDPDTTKDTGLFWNDRLILQEGVTQIDGMTVFLLQSSEDAFRMSDNGKYVIIECVLSGTVNLDAVVLIAVNRVDHTTATVSPGFTVAPSTPSNAFSTSLNDVRWNMRPGSIAIATLDPIRATFTFHLPVASVDAMKVVVESRATVGGIRQRVEVQQAGSSTFSSLESFSPLPGGVIPDRLVSLSVPSPNMHIDTANNNAVVVRLLAKNLQPISIFPWQYQVDQCYIEFDP